MSTSVFKETVVDFNLPKGANHLKHTYQLSSPDNTSLRVAKNERFDYMCADILWGSENKQEFGELLRGAVLTFLPLNRYHLQSLKTVVALQWQLNRLGVTQKHLFEAGASKSGLMNLPEGVHNAMSMNPVVSELLRDLQRAISIYQSIRGKIGK